MELLNVRDYRNNLAASFSRADKGEQVIIRRKNQLYALVNIGREDLIITPELQQRIDEARRAYISGNSVVCSNKKEIEDYLNSL